MADPNNSPRPSNEGEKPPLSGTATKSSLSPGPGANNGNSPKHDRKVSWNNDLIPALKKGGAYSPSPKSGSGSSSGNVSLKEVLQSKPMEMEAQTHILRAVEKMQTGHYRSDSSNQETDSLYRDIANEEISRSSKEAADAAAADGEKNNNSLEPAPEADEEKAEKESLLDNGSKSSNQTSVLAKGRFKSLVQKNVMNKKPNQGVEHTLFGLTTALAQAEKERKSQEDSASKLSNTANALAGKGDVEDQMNDTSDSDEESSEEFATPNGAAKKKKKSKKKKHGLRDQVADGIGENWSVFSQFFNPKNDKVEKYVRKVGMFIMLPALGLAAFLFYVVENPQVCEEKVQIPATEAPGGDGANVLETAGDSSMNMTNATMPPRTRTEEFVCPGLGASASWWLIFIGVRQVLTFTMALITQTFVIDFLSLGTRICLNWLGPVITMFFVQSRGWPFLAVWWAVYDLILLSGDRDYAHHWAYWQDVVGLFNEENPSGNVVDNEWNYKILRVAIFVGICVSVKRLALTLMLGKQTFARFGEQLAVVMKNMVLIGEVATLAKDIEKYSGEYANTTSDLLMSTPSKKNVQDMVDEEMDAQDVPEEVKANAADAAKSFVQNRNLSKEGESVVSSRTVQDEEFTQSEQLQLSQLLDAWEEPETASEREEKKISIGAVLQFRQALTFMRTRYPFLPAFGLADSREKCVDNASKVYDRLLLRTPDKGQLPFDTMALLAKNEDDGLNKDKAKLLIKVFRPDREGNLSKLDFVKSVDTVYKDLRMLSANVSNSSQIDKAVEKIFNIVFYIILGAFVLSLIGVDPMQVFLSLSGILLAFAFMFGGSSAKFFEGVLFILVHSPYGVGDRVHLSSPSEGTSIDGSSGWIVEKVSLYTTSFYWGATNERCTINNGAISNLRVINSNRSPNGQIFIFMKYDMNTPYEKFEIARAALEQYCKDRPREWLSFVCFRPTDVAVEGNYVSYMTIACHRAPWNDIGAILQSKSELITYQLEVCKQLGIGFEQPHLPVDIRYNNGQTLVNNGQPQSGEMGPSELATLAQQS